MALEQLIEQLDQAKSFYLKATNYVQANLMKESGEDYNAWINENSLNFNEIIEKNKKLFLDLYRENPGKAEHWAKRELEKMQNH